MKIGYDAKRAFLNNSGLGNYSRLIIESVAHQDECEVFAYTKSRGDLNFKPQQVSIKMPTGFFSLIPSMWRSSGIIADLKRDNIDVFHGLSGELPLGFSNSKIGKAVTIHDLIFLRFPELYKSHDRVIYKRKVRSSIEVADKVIAISNQTKSDLIDFFNISESRIAVIYQDCHHQFRQILDRESISLIKKKYKLPSEYVLTVGTIEERKNQLLVLKAAKKVGIPVVIVGRQTNYMSTLLEFVKKEALENEVFFLTEVPFADFPALYQGATVFMYPSLFEGFGIPILEALRSKVPVITSKGSCFEETGGKMTAYIKNNEEEATEALRQILNSKELKIKMVEEGVRHAQRFNVEKTLPQMLKVYRDIAP